MKKRNKMVLPSDLIPEDAKLKNGEEMLPRMVGAYYGSSFELNVVAEIQISNAGLLECPADQQLRTYCRPPKRKGEFGAFKSETQSVAQKQLGKSVFELKDEAEIRAVAKAVDNIFMVSGNTGKSLVYTDHNGHKISYAQLLQLRTAKQRDNDAVQAEKNALLGSRNCLPYMSNGVMVHPPWPEDVLQAIKAINQDKLWSPTGVNLKLTISGLHTIARDNAFYTGSLDQDGLNSLIEVLDYKEATSFFKGRVRNKSMTIPIQTLDQLKMLTKTFTEAGAVLAQFPSSVLNSRVVLARESD